MKNGDSLPGKPGFGATLGIGGTAERTGEGRENDCYI